MARSSQAICSSNQLDLGCISSHKGRSHLCMQSWLMPLVLHPIVCIIMSAEGSFDISVCVQIPRAAAALVLAPVADGLLIFVQARCRLRTRRNAFAFLVALCFLLALVVFGSVLLCWA